MLLIMDTAEPTRSLGPMIHLPVLAALARIDRPMSGRGIARLLEGKASPRGVSDALNYLVAQGVVLREDHPPAALYRLNRDHVAWGIAEALAGLRETLLSRCTAEIASWVGKPLWVALFGSAARGEGGVDSDIDMLVVLADDEPMSDAWQTRFDDLAHRIRSWTGNPASMITLSRHDFTASEEPYVREIARDAVTVWGRQPARRR